MSHDPAPVVTGLDAKPDLQRSGVTHHFVALLPHPEGILTMPVLHRSEIAAVNDAYLLLPLGGVGNGDPGVQVQQNVALMVGAVTTTSRRWSKSRGESLVA